MSNEKFSRETVDKLLCEDDLAESIEGVIRS